MALDSSALEKLLQLTSGLDAGNGANKPVRSPSTKVGGYPLFLSWGIWQGLEPREDESKPLKGLIFTPHVQVRQAPLVKFSGGSAIENPLDLLESVKRPYNLKLDIPEHLDRTFLRDGHCYFFLAALLPAALVSRTGGGATAYWEGALKAISADLELPAIKNFIVSYRQTIDQMARIRRERIVQRQEEIEEEDDSGATSSS